MAAGFVAVSVQLIRLAASGQSGSPPASLAGGLSLQSHQPVILTYSRPDIVDRQGRLLATDLSAFSLYADPARVLDPDETAEALVRVLPALDRRELRGQLADTSRRFIWIRRGLSAELAQRVHDLGFPGLGFRTEPKRRYPQSRLAGHILGSVSIDNKGLSGVERHIDTAFGLESGLAGDSGRPPVTLTIDIGVQHGLEEELAAAMARYRAVGAVGIILDIGTGAILAASSMPDVDPSTPLESLEPERMDRLHVANYELGSVFKLATVAMALELGVVTASTRLDTMTPLQADGFLIRDPHPAARPLTPAEIFIRSSNVGAGRLALLVGGERQRDFVERLGLTTRLSTGAGITAVPNLPERWGEVETVTISYGHGIAVAPMQFAAAAATLVNGGRRIEPFVVRSAPGTKPHRPARAALLKPEVAAQLHDMMRRAVTEPGGTGRLAAVDGYDVGGKTGTAEIAVGGRYLEKSVISTFLAAFPMWAPRHLVLVVLIEPKPEAGSDGRISAGAIAAPLAGRVIRRTGPLLARAVRQSG